MRTQILSAIVQRIALPILTLLCVAFRPCIISYIYLIFLFWLPFVPLAPTRTWHGYTRVYLFALMFTALLMLIGQVGFQIVLLSFPKIQDEFTACLGLEQILRHIGFVRLNNLDALSVFLWIFPDIAMMIITIVIYFLSRKFFSLQQVTLEEVNVELVVQERDSRKKAHRVLRTIGNYMSLFCLCFTGILTPSLIGILYFLTFLTSSTLWACCVQLRRKFAYTLRLILVIMFIHLSAIYVYQMEWPQSQLPSDSPYVRYLAIKPIIKMSCDNGTDPRHITIESHPWTIYFLPVMLYLSYFIIALTSTAALHRPAKTKFHGTLAKLNEKQSTITDSSNSFLRRTRSRVNRSRWHDATHRVRDRSTIQASGETTPLLRSTRPPGSKTAYMQDSTGSVIVGGEHPGDIPLNDLDSNLDGKSNDLRASFLDALIDIVENILHLINQSSYILTSIMMMTWSITYLSWLSFIFLIWANILWLIPNQRAAMLRCSPFLVAYAWFLLLSSYIYCIEFTEEELPSKYKEVNLAQIGFVKVTDNAVSQLAVKCLFSIMFWITLRQFITERREAQQKEALERMAAPLQAVTGVAAGVTPEPEPSGKMLKIRKFFRRICTKYWIWVVAITLFIVAITGQRMTLFRIIYMALFLVFVLSFQISFRLWRRMMFAFWLIVIIYSMLILVLIYTYQFDYFPHYWEKYLGVPLEQQLDIGLELYLTKELFVRLITPVFFVIITVIQLHYFHKDFMELSDPAKNTALSDEKIAEEKRRKETMKFMKPFKLSDLMHMDKKQTRQLIKASIFRTQKFLDYVYLFLEIHAYKMVYLYVICMCCFDSCVVYFPVLVLFILSTGLSYKIQRVIIYLTTVYVAIFLLSRMIFQIKYINPDSWNVTCRNETVNNAEWLGFEKKESKLAVLLKWNIAYILLSSLRSVIIARQQNYRVSRGLPIERPSVMFPLITRKDADKNVASCLKFLLNYGFYKFGIEICLIALVIVIGVRMDVVAAIYSICLIILCCLNRSQLSKIWNVFAIFIAMLIILQYIMVLGLPPGLCIRYPWENMDPELLDNIKAWAYIATGGQPPARHLIIFDAVLLMLVTRQSIVFAIEKFYTDKNEKFPGGNNGEMVKEIDQPDFNNPVPDFITYSNSLRLDTLKRSIFLSLFWLSLAMAFLAGTNRVNIFSLGYLIGTFIFLWEGSDIYLRPLNDIRRSWNLFLMFNVIVIVAKSVLQILGCILITKIPRNTCLIFQLFAIGCVHTKTQPTHPMDTNVYSCKVPDDQLGITWDALSFVASILTLRLFKSYYFLHIINEMKAATILASRGAELIEELRIKRMLQQRDREIQVLNKIRSKMERIKANQRKLGSVTFPTDNHYVDTQQTMARSSSMSSCTSQQTTPAGYHTPIDDEEPAPLTPRSSSLQPQAPPSPYSAVMTVSLEGYLEPQRMSFSSPPNSDLNPRPPSPDDSFPVFSPPPYDAAPPYTEAVSSETRQRMRRQSSIGPPWMQGQFVAPRPSLLSYSSRFSHREYSIHLDRPMYRKSEPKSYKAAILSGDYYMFDDIEDEDAEIEKEMIALREESAAKKEKMGGKTTLGELISTILKTDVDTAIRRHSESDVPPLERTQSIPSIPASAPATYRDGRGKTVDFQDKSESPSEDPQPGTSKHSELSEIKKEEDGSGNMIWANISKSIVLIWMIIESALLSFILLLNGHSKDYRYILRVMSTEKRILKERTAYNRGYRVGARKIWQPAHTFKELTSNMQITNKDDYIMTTPSIGTFSPSDSYRISIPDGSFSRRVSQASDQDPILSIHSDNSSTTSQTQSQSQPPNTYEVLQRGKMNIAVIPEIRILGASKEGGLNSPSSSERDQITIEQFESEDLRPQDINIFFRTIIAIYHLMLSKSELFAYFAIFLNQIKTATLLSLPLPLMVFFWGSLTLPRPRKTFWVTIIAYIECAVLIKCIFQFDIIPWNDSLSVYSNALYPPKIIGVEQVRLFAVWDLIVLLGVFFHRYLLKSLGLWSSHAEKSPVLTSGEYILKPDGQLVPISQDVRKVSALPKDLEYTIAPVMITEKGSPPDDSPLTEEEKLAYVNVQPVDPCLPGAIAVGTNKYLQPMRMFFRKLLDPTARVACDIYSYMFLCDFFNFFVIILGYSSFGSQKGDVSSYIKENRVPTLFLVMLIIQFMLIITDRGIYLTRNLSAKVIFQYLQVIFLHIWLFFLFPLFTERSFTNVLAPQIYYMVKAFYLLLSAYQIRCGYPTRILGNFLCRGYNHLNMWLFKAFWNVPFLWELRTVMDWMWTETSMTIFDWIKMEDIFAHMYLTKCTRYVDNEFPAPRGEKRTHFNKYFVGGSILCALIALIWFPLVFFSLVSAVGNSNPPYEVQLELRIGPFEPVYQISAQSNSITQFKYHQYNKLKDQYDKSPEAAAFLKIYDPEDIAAVSLSSFSANVWSISPPDRSRMVDELGKQLPIRIELIIKIFHKTNKPEDSGAITVQKEYLLPPDTPESPNANRKNLLEMLEAANPTDHPAVVLPYILPKFLKVTNRGSADVLSELMVAEPTYKATTHRNMTLTLNNTGEDIMRVEWWKLAEVCNDYNDKMFLQDLPCYDCLKSIVLYTFNDKIFPANFRVISEAGIIGLYTTIVFVASRVLKGLFADQYTKIMFDDLPSVDRIYQLLSNIYLVREAKEFALEEDLFAKLIFLFRSPETLIKWTRTKQEETDDEDEDEDDDDDDDDEDEDRNDNGAGKEDGVRNRNAIAAAPATSES